MAEHALVQLARRTVEQFVREGKVLAATHQLDDLGRMRAGAFVSLHHNGHLRGCIGTIEPVRADLEQEVIHNAIAAATQDPRFLPVRADELDGLEISVDVLGAPEAVETVEELDPQIYGVIVQRGKRRGLLLPDLEGVESAQQQIDIALSKAGIGRGEPYRLYRFRVDRYH